MRRQPTLGPVGRARVKRVDFLDKWGMRGMLHYLLDKRDAWGENHFTTWGQFRGECPCGNLEFHHNPVRACALAAETWRNHVVSSHWQRQCKLMPVHDGPHSGPHRARAIAISRILRGAGFVSEDFLVQLQKRLR